MYTIFTLMFIMRLISKSITTPFDFKKGHFSVCIYLQRNNITFCVLRTCMHIVGQRSHQLKEQLAVFSDQAMHLLLLYHAL